MREPELVEVARQNATSENIEQVVYAVDARAQAPFCWCICCKRAASPR